MKSRTQFNSKLLLFGEYGLMAGAMALSVPFSKFSASLDFDMDELNQDSTAEIENLYRYLKKDKGILNLNYKFDLQRMKNNLQNGLYLKSNIPQKYGVGSSGALVAALFDRYSSGSYSKTAPDPNLLKEDFSRLERYFHGTSSGIDPLISYLNRPLILDAAKQIQLVDFDLQKSGVSVALIDTGTTGATGPLVEYFMALYKDPVFKHVFETRFIPANNTCIETLLKGELPRFFQHLEQLIRFELEYFQRMFTGNFPSVIENALNSEVYIKLLGSGGGGFLIAMADNDQVMDRWSASSGTNILRI